MGRRVDYLVVAFRDDFSLLRLQARSMARFLDPDSTGGIFVVNNDRAPAEFARRFDRAIRPEYGALGTKVELVPADALLSPGAGRSGYWRQQGAKLRGYRLGREPAYVTLDCKNILIRPVGAASFFAADGRLAAPQRKFAGHLAGGLDYFGVPPDQRPALIVNIYTPIPLWRAQCAALDAFVAAREGFGVDELLNRAIGDGRPRLYEFLLYGGWLHAMAGGIEAHHALQRAGLSTTYMCTTPDQTPEHVMNELRQPRFPMMGVHRRTITAPEAVRRGFAAVWRDVGLVASEEEGMAVIANAGWGAAGG
jgi:hypothetical protein